MTRSAIHRPYQRCGTRHLGRLPLESGLQSLPRRIRIYLRVVKVLESASVCLPMTDHLRKRKGEPWVFPARRRHRSPFSFSGVWRGQTHLHLCRHGSGHDSVEGCSSGVLTMNVMKQPVRTAYRPTSWRKVTSYHGGITVGATYGSLRVTVGFLTVAAPLGTAATTWVGKVWCHEYDSLFEARKVGKYSAVHLEQPSMSQHSVDIRFYVEKE